MKQVSAAAKMMKKLRSERRSGGLCPYCGEVNDRPGKYYCSRCAEIHNEKKTEWVEKRLVSRICPRCGGELDREGFTCSVCKEKVRLSAAEIKRRYLEAGLCQRCGKEAPMPGVKYCHTCAERDRARRQKQRATEILVDGVENLGSFAEMN